MNFRQLSFILTMLAFGYHQSIACQAPNLLFKHFNQEQILCWAKM
jgi:hypothetical protein